MHSGKRQAAVIKMGQFDAFRRYKLFVPTNFVFTDGIVRNIPLYYEPEQLMKIINSKVPIVSIERLNYWNKFTNTSQPNTSLKIKFRSAILYLLISRLCGCSEKQNCLCIFCNVSLKYGHFNKYCDADKYNPLCRVCAKPPHNKDNVCVPFCKQCKIEHVTADRNCPVYKHKFEIKRVMALKKVVASDKTKS